MSSYLEDAYFINKKIDELDNYIKVLEQLKNSTYNPFENIDTGIKKLKDSKKKLTKDFNSRYKIALEEADFIANAQVFYDEASEY